jgi:hypothetical protein
MTDHMPSLTFMDPWTDQSRNSAMDNRDTLDRTADVVAFVNAAVTFPREIDFTDQERCGLASILRAVEHTMRQAGELVASLAGEAPDPAKVRQQELRIYMDGYKARKAEEEAGTEPSYPRFDTPEGEEGDGVISDAPEPAPKKRGAARS